MKITGKRRPLDKMERLFVKHWEGKHCAYVPCMRVVYAQEHFGNAMVGPEVIQSALANSLMSIWPSSISDKACVCPAVYSSFWKLVGKSGSGLAHAYYRLRCLSWLLESMHRVFDRSSVRLKVVEPQKTKTGLFDHNDCLTFKNHEDSTFVIEWVYSHTQTIPGTRYQILM